MNKICIPFSPPDITEEEIEEVGNALRSGWITTGPRTKKFEKEICNYLDVENCVCLNSATAAEELNFRILGIKDGDEVIVPAYTYTATASAAIHCGATIKMVDCQKNSTEMDYDQLEKSISSKTKAIVPVDLGGVPCDYDKIYQIINEKRELFSAETAIQKAIGRVAVVADGAHALGASRNGVKVGNLADFTSFSFHAVKNLTTAEGGCAVWKHIDGINDGELYHQYQLYSLHGQSKDALSKTKAGAWEYDIVGPWYKCNMTDIMAAIGLIQLKRYPSLLKRRYEIIDMYDEFMDEMNINHIIHKGNNYISSGHLYMIRIPDISESQRNEIITCMAEKGVSTNVHYKPLPMMTAYKKMGIDINDFPNAYEMYHNEITLPLHTKLTNDDVKCVISTLEEILKEMNIL